MVMIGMNENNRPHLGGGRVLHYLDDAGSYDATNSTNPDAYRYPDRYGKPTTLYEGNLNNSIFALWADYFNDSTDSIVMMVDVMIFQFENFGMHLLKFLPSVGTT